MAERKARTVKTARRRRVKRSVRNKVHGSSACPRLTVFRSNKHIYAQLIDDAAGTTLAAASSLDKAVEGNNPTEVGREVGQLLARKAKEVGVNAAVFDRNGYRYLGRVRSLADGAREGGLAF